jgi:hypothetical protein
MVLFPIRSSPIILALFAAGTLLFARNSASGLRSSAIRALWTDRSNNNYRIDSAPPPSARGQVAAVPPPESGSLPFRGHRPLVFAFKSYEYDQGASGLVFYTIISNDDFESFVKFLNVIKLKLFKYYTIIDA